MYRHFVPGFVVLGYLLLASGGCGSDRGACVYSHWDSSSEMYEYRCENGLSKSECGDQHDMVDFYAGKCCDPNTAFIDNPGDCTN